MGASEWNYAVPYREDLGAVLAELQRKVFEEREYYWAPGADWRPEEERQPYPATVEELWSNELVQELWTHSILDIFEIVAPGQDAGYNTLKPVTEDEALRVLGTRKLTRGHVPEFDAFPYQRWQGRCAVLHDASGEPAEIYFWGASGD